MGAKQREIVGKVMPVYRELAGTGPDRNLHHAVLSPHPAAAVRFQYRRGVASRRAAAAPVPLSGRRPTSSWRWRASTSSTSSAWRRRVCGRRKARFPTKSSPSPPKPASTGPPPTAACWAARWAAPSAWTPSIARTAGSSTAAQIGVIFRDHFLSDLIGFVYSEMDCRRGRATIFCIASAKTAAAFWRPAAMPWCPSFSMAKTPGNTTTTTAVPSCAICTAAFPRTRRWPP